MDSMVTIQKYVEQFPSKEEIHFWDLPSNTLLGFNKTPKRVDLRGKWITKRKILEQVGKDDITEKSITELVLHKSLNRSVKIGFPIQLSNIHYTKLFALMSSEGSAKTEFALHVPEKEFHEIFEQEIIHLLGQNIKPHIKKHKWKGVHRSRAPAVIRYLIPIYKFIPGIIMENKEFSRRYLRIAFEAEGSPIYSGNKRYISLKRNIGLRESIQKKVKYPAEKRIYFKKLEKDYPDIAKEIKNNPPKLLLGEFLMLKEYFKLRPKIEVEAIRINKTDNRFGKVSARWALYLYAEDVNKFIREVGFITPRKQRKGKKMLQIEPRKRQYYAFEIMKQLQEQYGEIKRSEFIKKMDNYTTPQTYLWRYEKKGIIKRIARGRYEIVKNPLEQETPF